MSSNQKVEKFQTKFGEHELEIEVGKLAKQADGAVTVRYGDTVILAAAVSAKEPAEGNTFFPMLIDYEEKLYAAGKISGSRFVKREGRPSDAAVLNARLVDRSLRPLFPKAYRNDLQIIVTVLSLDRQTDPGFLAIIAASSALLQTSAPFAGPVAACRVGLIDGKPKLNPSEDEMEKSELDLIIAGTNERIVMIEGQGKETSEEKVLQAIDFAQKNLKEIIKIQQDLKAKLGPEKIERVSEEREVLKAVREKIGKELKNAIKTTHKEERDQKLAEMKEQLLLDLKGDFKQSDITEAFDELVEKEVRYEILKEGKRPDGRGEDEIRPIECEIGLLPRVHGSGLFTRGQTQVLTATTLGAPGQEQVIETMEVETTKRYMHHYNFPPYSVGEISPMRGPGRRDIGHGALAERALVPVLPSKEDFPYTIRVVSEVLESNGSSSMASVCGSTLSLMDAGVPITTPVAGIAIGLVSEKADGTVSGKYRILTDIQGIEDFAGEMDFKIAGTSKGITAIQLDIKTPGIESQILKESLAKAKDARLKILETMIKTIAKPKTELSKYAPRITVLHINPEKIKDVIGPGGKVINKIIAETNVEIDIEDDGTVFISAENGGEGAKKACEWIQNLTREVKVGEVFQGRVTRIMDFGAFVEILPNQEGLVHISQLADYHVKKVTDVVKVGDVIPVMVIEIDQQGRINLSYKAAKSGIKPSQSIRREPREHRNRFSRER
jgi:polyribonucleotide nucleotidyltransferase